MLLGYAGMKPATRGTRLFLYGAGAFNLGAALTLVLCARLAPGLLGLDPMSPSQFLYVDLFAALVLGFGFAYALGGYDLPRFWPFVAFGVIGKTMVVLIAWTYFARGATGALPALLAAGDAIFAVLVYRLLRVHALGGN